MTGDHCWVIERNFTLFTQFGAIRPPWSFLPHRRILKGRFCQPNSCSEICKPNGKSWRFFIWNLSKNLCVLYTVPVPNLSFSILKHGVTLEFSAPLPSPGLVPSLVWIHRYRPLPWCELHKHVFVKNIDNSQEGECVTTCGPGYVTRVFPSQTNHSRIQRHTIQSIDLGRNLKRLNSGLYTHVRGFVPLLTFSGLESVTRYRVLSSAAKIAYFSIVQHSILRNEYNNE